jgi:hypothetical protein
VTRDGCLPPRIDDAGKAEPPKHVVDISRWRWT